MEGDVTLHNRGLSSRGMCKIWKIPNVCFLVADCCSVVARDKSRTVVADIFLHCVVCV